MNSKVESEALVSMVIPSYNHAKYVEESIRSIIAQTYDNIELIIIDDGSSDNSVEIIERLAPECEKRFTRFEFRHRPNKGLSSTLNEALLWSKGKYFSPLASDDIALPHKIEFLMSKIIDSDYAGVFGEIESIGSEPIRRKQARKIIYHHFSDLMHQKYMPAAPGSLLRRDVVASIGGFREDIRVEDWCLWLTITSNGYSLVTYPVTVSKYRSHDSNTVKNVEVMVTARRQTLELFKQSMEYRDAVRRNFLVEARARAAFEVWWPILLVLKSRTLSRLSVFVLCKALLPVSFLSKVTKLNRRNFLNKVR